jgi:hypothetical protein
MTEDTRPICECCRQRPADVMDTFSDGPYVYVCCMCLNDGRAVRRDSGAPLAGRAPAVYEEPEVV